MFDPRRILVILALLGGLSMSPVHAGDVGIQALSLERSDGGLHIRATVVLAANVAAVRRILASPEALPALNPRVDGIEVMERNGDDSRVRVNAHRCVLWVCSQYEWVQSISVSTSGDVLVSFDGAPGSSVREGEASYSLRSIGEELTEVQVDANLVHAIDLPPVIGPLVMRKALTDDMRIWARNLVAEATDRRRSSVLLASTSSGRIEAKRGR